MLEWSGERGLTDVCNWGETDGRLAKHLIWNSGQSFLIQRFIYPYKVKPIYCYVNNKLKSHKFNLMP